MARPYWWFKNQDAKMLGAVGGLFQVSFSPLSGWKKVSLISKQVKMLEV